MAAQSPTDDRRAAAGEAAELLAPFRGDPSIHRVIGTLTTVAEGEGDEDGATGDDLETALAKIGAARAELEKDEKITPMQAITIGERLAKAERALQAEYLAQHSVGYARSQANMAEEARLRAERMGSV